jgi:hypothetical protein
MGMITEVDAHNFNREGSAFPDGSAIKRRYGIDGYEFYGQDSWKVKPSLTLTFGLRWSLFSPPWETNGLQVSPSPGLDSWYLQRSYSGQNGIPSNQDTPITFDWSAPANGKPNYYNWDYKNLGPCVAFARASELVWRGRPDFHSRWVRNCVRSIRPRHSYTFDFSVARELKGGFSIEASYVGRLGKAVDAVK